MKNKKIIIIISALILVAIIGIIIYSQSHQKRAGIFIAPIELQKGLAMSFPSQEDLTKLGDVWYYNWGACPLGATNCVPMSWCGEDPNLPLNYSGYLLLFNEPEVETQCNITPQHGIDDYMFLKMKYPAAKFVVGNSIFWGSWQYWLNFFWDICNANKDCIIPQYWGIHVYISGNTDWIPYIDAQLTRLHKRLGGTFWITEFAEINGNINTDNALVSLFLHTPWIARWAYFTNRSQATDPWVINGWKVDLFDWNTGEPTDIGTWYIHGIYKTALPMINRSK